LTSPVTYASRRTILSLIIASVHHRRSKQTDEFWFFHHTGSRTAPEQ
jgi:hypothetical protein